MVIRKSRVEVALIELLILLSSFSAIFLLQSPSFAEGATSEVSVTVATACSMSATVPSSHTATIVSGQTATNIGTTNLKATCNDSAGYAIYAIGFTSNQYGNTVLAGAGLDKSFNIKTNSLVDSNISSWSMKLSRSGSNYIPVIVGSSNDGERTASTPDYSDYQAVPEEYIKVAYYPTATDTGNLAVGSNLTTTYRVHVAPTQPAGTYIGQVKYVLVHPNAEFPFPEDTLVGTTLHFNEHLDVESLIPIIGQYDENDLHFAVKIKVTDILYHLGVQDPNITTWSQLVDSMPSLLALTGATDIQSNMQVLDKNQDYSYINYISFESFTYQDPYREFLYYYRNGRYDDTSSWSHVPASTGSISYTLDGERYTYSSIREIIGATVNGAWLDEQYYADSWYEGEDFFRTISIYGGEDATNQDLIAWLKANSTVAYVTDNQTDSWTFNTMTSSDSDMYWGITGTVYSDQYTQYQFESIFTNTDYGIPIWGFNYSSIASPYEPGDGFAYLTSDLIIPEYGINYTRGWYFGNNNRPTEYVPASPPTIILSGGDDLYNPSFATWLYDNASPN